MISFGKAMNNHLGLSPVATFSDGIRTSTVFRPPIFQYTKNGEKTVQATDVELMFIQKPEGSVIIVKRTRNSHVGNEDFLKEPMIFRFKKPPKMEKDGRCAVFWSGGASLKVCV